MTELNLPTYDVKLKEIEGAQHIYDIIRKQYIICTPEEWVRQHVIHYLISHKNYPGGRMAVEKSIKVDQLLRRPDIVVFDDELKPLLIVELKAPSVNLSNETLLQTAMYNKQLKAAYIMLSNGLQHYFTKVNYESGKLDFISEIPDYEELLK